IGQPGPWLAWRAVPGPDDRTVFCSGEYHFAGADRDGRLRPSFCRDHDPSYCPGRTRAEIPRYPQARADDPVDQPTAENSWEALAIVSRGRVSRLPPNRSFSEMPFVSRAGAKDPK